MEVIVRIYYICVEGLILAHVHPLVHDSVSLWLHGPRLVDSVYLLGVLSSSYIIFNFFLQRLEVFVIIKTFICIVRVTLNVLFLLIYFSISMSFVYRNPTDYFVLLIFIHFTETVYQVQELHDGIFRAISVCYHIIYNEYFDFVLFNLYSLDLLQLAYCSS